MDKRSRRELDVHSSIISCSTDPCSTLLLCVTAVEGIVYWYSLRVNPLDGIGQTCDCPCHNVANPPLLLRVVDKFFVEEGVGPLLNTYDGLPKKEFELKRCKFDRGQVQG